MRLRTLTSSASALLVLATAVDAKSGSHDLHAAFHRKQREQARAVKSEAELGKRSGQCQFPTNAGLVAVTPGSANAGWAMSPDQSCTPGSYCPYACPPGQVSMQWDPSATSYSYPQSMNGGLYCDSTGAISKPFPNRAYCQATAANIGVVNNAGGSVSFCQTVLPGNEAMLIPTVVTGSATLANPGTDYWCGTAAHYYINPPGTSAASACVWGTNASPVGNWSPYVAGSNVDASGTTYIKLGWNPIYLETTTPFRSQMPNWGVKIDCPNGGCSGLPCSIDPTANSVNGMSGAGISYGAGGASFCVVSVAQGSTANFVVYSGSGSSAQPSSSGWNNWNSGNPGGNFNAPTGAGKSAAASSSAGSNSVSISGGVGLGGQFYAVTSGIAASPTTTTTSATTTTTSTTSTTTTSKPTTTSVTTTWTGYNLTTTEVPIAPSGSPYYSLFNSSLTATATATGNGHSASGTKASGLPIGTSTGGASQVGMSAVGFAVAMWSLLI